MKPFIVAFDVDGTLANNTKPPFVANERIRNLVLAFAHMKFVNVRLPEGGSERRKVYIMVWSGGGAVYAAQAARELGIAHYVDEYAGKNPNRTVGKTETASKLVFNPGFVPDMAFDDIQDCDLAELNFIVREK